MRMKIDMLSGNGWNGRSANSRICSYAHMLICAYAHMRTIFTGMNGEAGGRAELGKVASCIL